MKSIPSIIRFAENKDLPQLIILFEEHAQYENACFTKKGKEEALKEHLFNKTPSLYCLVVEVENKVIGYATYMKQFSTWDTEHYIYMDCLYLSDNWRGFGIGEKLIQKIKDESSKLCCSLIQWQTPDSNKKAIKFYNRIGATSKTKERFFLNL